jgi:hypothetical protein
LEGGYYVFVVFESVQKSAKWLFELDLNLHTPIFSTAQSEKISWKKIGENKISGLVV